MSSERISAYLSMRVVKNTTKKVKYYVILIKICIHLSVGVALLVSDMFFTLIREKTKYVFVQIKIQNLFNHNFINFISLF